MAETRSRPGVESSFQIPQAVSIKEVETGSRGPIPKSPRLQEVPVPATSPSVWRL